MDWACFFSKVCDLTAFTGVPGQIKKYMGKVKRLIYHFNREGASVCRRKGTRIWGGGLVAGKI